MSQYREYPYEPLSPRCNYTDPVVRHDPQFSASPVAKYNSSSKPEQPAVNTQDVDFKRIEGVSIPVVRINLQVVNYQLIEYVHVDYDDFVPTATIVITQRDHSFEVNEIPGMNNICTVVMVAAIDGAYKPISIDFYITNISYQGDQIKYYCTYKHPGLEVPHTEQVTFNPYPNTGCTAKYCNLPPNKYPNTFEFLHWIAVNQLGLGYATTDKVKEIRDDRTRIISNETYITTITDAIRTAGLDSDTVLDGWIDLYRYLVVVNVKWLMDEDVKYNDISWRPTVGINGQEDEDLAGGEKEHIETYRMLTNSTNSEDSHNLLIENYNWVVDNSEIYDEGTTVQYMVGSPTATGGTGGVEQTDVQVTESSTDGINHASRYNYARQEFLGYELGDPEDHNLPILLQTQVHDAFFKKFRAKRLRIKMSKPNFAIQRGTIIMCSFFLKDEQAKNQYVRNIQNLEGSEEPYSDDEKDEEIRKRIEGDAEILDVTMSGFYYVDGMEFEYVKGKQCIDQYVFLIKKGLHRNLQSIDTVPKLPS